MSNAYQDSDQDPKTKLTETPCSKVKNPVTTTDSAQSEQPLALRRTTVVSDQIADIFASYREAADKPSADSAVHNTTNNGVFQTPEHLVHAGQADGSGSTSTGNGTVDDDPAHHQANGMRLSPIRVVHSNVDIDESLAAGDVATYLADMLGSLEVVAQRSHLDVLSMMIAMAREQAGDDAASHRKANG